MLFVAFYQETRQCTRDILIILDETIKEGEKELNTNWHDRHKLPTHLITYNYYKSKVPHQLISSFFDEKVAKQLHVRQAINKLHEAKLFPYLIIISLC